MQIQGTSAGGPLSVVGGIVRDEGVFGLTRGLSASLLRQGVYSSTRFGVYDIGKQYLTDNGQTALPLHYKVANGLVSGAIGAAVGSPADLAMVRMQADGRLPAAQRRNYKNVGDALIRVSREEGVLALWRGCGPTVQRAMIVTAGQLASYDQAKEAFVRYAKMSEDDVSTHISASLTAGVVASVASNPVDLIKTRLMNMKANADGTMPYRCGGAEAFQRIVMGVSAQSSCCCCCCLHRCCNSQRYARLCAQDSPVRRNPRSSKGPGPNYAAPVPVRGDHVYLSRTN